MRGALDADWPDSGDFTPFGYLRNPGHRASSWQSVEGGNLRTTFEWVGVEWVYPLQRDPQASVGIRLETTTRHRRGDFAAVGLTSRCHSSNVLGFDWQADGLAVAARFFLVDNDTLGARLEVTNTGIDPREVDVTFMQHAQGDMADLEHVLVRDPQPYEKLAPGERSTRWAALARAPSDHVARQHATEALARAPDRLSALHHEDREFAAHCPRLSGDWPSGWREGLYYDFQTTRLLVQPAGGIFKDVWPAWMVAWPRVVLAEGTLDMLRLGYADPALAQRAIVSMFRAAAQPNVPCVFEDGGFNMLAADGSRCGTSPAWCLPFLNLQLLYLRTLDRAWLAELYPYLVEYLGFWLRERTDPRGWVVYKCTWESGEDGNPRLDPHGTGEGVIDSWVRPVELQATMAHAAQVMRFFEAELGYPPTRRWQAIERAYRQRTRRLFDAGEGRYRDWLIQEGRPQQPRPDQPYWGVDSCRWSPLGLTPLLIGEPLDVDEIWRHAQGPWTWWPSWTYALVESAAAAGYFSEVGALAAQIIQHVYRVITRHEVGTLERPMPGCAPEFWPEDWGTYQGHDAYGWGATTANLLIRHVFGFKESRITRTWACELAPALPIDLRAPGQRLGMHNLQYRDLSLDLDYEVRSRSGDMLRVTLRLHHTKRRCRVRAANGRIVHQLGKSRAEHQFELRNGHVYRLELS